MSDKEVEEEDYMSDAFLAQCLAKDVRPGLSRPHAAQRQHELKRKAELSREGAKPKKTSKELEEEKRQEGLKTSLDQTNKGFAMLQKMGYKSGESLGKSNSGRVEPVPIQVKSNRGGLGREAVLQEIAEEKRIIRDMKFAQKKQSEVSTDEYRASLSRHRRLNSIQSDLYRSQKVCKDLDQSKNVAEPVETWFWPPRVPEPRVVDEDEEEEEGEVEEEEEEECEFEPDEQLIILTCYLRREYFYCLWCGNGFVDDEDLCSSCPGRTRDDHY